MKLLDEIRANPRGKTAMWTFLIVGFVLGFAFSAVIPPITSWGATQAPPHCVVKYPTYDHCSHAQVLNIEAGTVRRVERHYSQPRRWGQHAHIYAGISAAANHKLARGFRRAVHRWNVNHTKRASLRYTSWSAYKADAYCAGTFGSISPLQWCAFSNSLDHAIQSVTQPAVHVALGCAGTVIEVETAGAAANKWMSLAIKPLSMEGLAVGGIAGCAAHKAWDFVTGLFSKTRP